MDLAKLSAPECASSLSFDGQTYTVAKDGTVEVPTAAVADLIGCHGYTVALESPKKTKKEAKAEE